MSTQRPTPNAASALLKCHNFTHMLTESQSGLSDSFGILQEMRLRLCAPILSMAVKESLEL
jgi:hypothetical protein